jgi:hypothetical protein
MLALLADLVSANRKLIEESLIRLRRLESAQDRTPYDPPSRRLNT